MANQMEHDEEVIPSLLESQRVQNNIAEIVLGKLKRLVRQSGFATGLQKKGMVVNEKSDQSQLPQS